MRTNRRLLTGAVAGISLLILAVSPSDAQQVPAAGQSPTIDKIKKDGKLRAGVAIAWPWLGQDPKTGKYIGAAADLGDRLAQTLGVQIEYVPSGWDVIVAGLQAHQFEVALAPLFATPKRMAVVDFANYTEGGTCYMVLKTNTKIKTLDDLNKPDVTTGTFTGNSNLNTFYRWTTSAGTTIVKAPNTTTCNIYFNIKFSGATRNLSALSYDVL